MGQTGTLRSLSVVVPNYNHSKYLERCLTAIVRQSFSPLEIIVLDDASTDNSVQVIKRFAAEHSLVRLVQNEKNLGVMSNLNKGAGLSRGEYIFIASADDEVLPGIFEKSMNLLAQHPRAGISSTISIWRYVDSGLSWHMAAGMSDKPAYLSPDEVAHLAKKSKLLISSNTVVFRKAALEDVGLFKPDLRWHADWFAMTTCAFRYGLCFIPEVLGIINILPKSFFTAGRRTQEHRQVLTNILDNLNSPAYSDVRPLIRDSGALSLFAPEMLTLIGSNKKYRPYLSGPFLRGSVKRTAELAGKKILPKWLARCILNVLYRAPATNPA